MGSTCTHLGNYAVGLQEKSAQWVSVSVITKYIAAEIKKELLMIIFELCCTIEKVSWHWPGRAGAFGQEGIALAGALLWTPGMNSFIHSRWLETIFFSWPWNEILRIMNTVTLLWVFICLFSMFEKKEDCIGLFFFFFARRF